MNSEGKKKKVAAIFPTFFFTLETFMELNKKEANSQHIQATLTVASIGTKFQVNSLRKGLMERDSAWVYAWVTEEIGVPYL